MVRFTQSISLNDKSYTNLGIRHNIHIISNGVNEVICHTKAIEKTVQVIKYRRTSNNLPCKARKHSESFFRIKKKKLVSSYMLLGKRRPKAS